MSQAFTRHEVGWVSQQWLEQEEGVLGDVTNYAELLRQGCGNRLDFLVNSFVLENKGGGVDGRKWWEGVRCGDLLRSSRCMVDDRENIGCVPMSDVGACGDEDPLR